MEQPKELVYAIEQEVPRSPREHIIQEIRNDLSAFSDSDQAIMEKMLSGEVLRKEEQQICDYARDKWWQDKYGFPYNNKAARTEVIMQKYAKPQEIAAAHTLQDKLLQACGERNDAEIARLKQDYIEQYPDQLEGVEIIFGLEQYLKDQEAIDPDKQERKPTNKDARKIFQSITEYNFLLTHFIYNNSNDKAFLEKLWAVLGAMADRKKELPQFHQLQRGIATQVATALILKELGLKPKLSHPSEDAFNAIDLWTDTAAVQIKGGKQRLIDNVFIETDTIAFPGIEATRKMTGEEKKELSKTYHINSHMFQEAQRFQTKLSKYNKLTGKNMRGYFFMIPYQKIDFVTGKPTPDLIATVKERMDAELK